MKYQLVFGEEFNEIKEVLKANCVIFTDELGPKGVEIDDLSNDRDGSVVGWLEGNGVYKVSTQNEGQKVIFNEDCTFMFAECENLKMIDFNFIDTTAVETMSWMFDECRNLEKLDLSNFDTSKVENMASMFSYCNFAYLDLSNFDTAHVTDMSEMFYGCKSMESINIKFFNTSKVRYMTLMFAGCSKLKKIRLGAFDTSKVEDMSYMFDKCTSLKKVYTTNEMFYSRYVLYSGGLLQDCKKMHLGDIQN